MGIISKLLITAGSLQSSLKGVNSGSDKRKPFSQHQVSINSQQGVTEPYFEHRPDPATVTTGVSQVGTFEDPPTIDTNDHSKGIDPTQKEITIQESNLINELSAEISSYSTQERYYAYEKMGLAEGGGFCFGASRRFIEIGAVKFLKEFKTLLKHSKPVIFSQLCDTRQPDSDQCLESRTAMEEMFKLGEFIPRLIIDQKSQRFGFSLPFNQLINLNNLNHALSELSNGQKIMIITRKHAIAVEKTGQTHYVVFDINQHSKSGLKSVTEAEQVIRAAFDSDINLIMMSSKQQLPEYTITEQLDEQLYLYAKNGALNMIEPLLDNGANPNIVPFFEEKLTALGVASQNAHVDIVRLLLKKGADPNQEYEGMSVLYIAAGRGHTDVVEALLKKGANPNQEYEGMSVLYTAAGRGHTDVVEALLKKGVDPNQEYNGVPVLDLVAENGHTEIVEALLRTKGIKVNADALKRAAEKGHIDVVKVLLEKGADPKNKAHALIIAAFKGHIDVVKVLLEKGADPNIDSGRALVAACLEGHTGVVNLLLENGADPSRASLMGFTASMIAASKGHTDIVELLQNPARREEL